MASRALSDLHPAAEKLARRFTARCREAGLDVLIYCTLRTAREQNELYAQGRGKPGLVVTNAKGGQSAHNYGLAFDCCPMRNGKLVWGSRDALYDQMGVIGEAVGLEWAGRWKSLPGSRRLQLLESVHFQFPGWREFVEKEGLKCV